MEWDFTDHGGAYYLGTVSVTIDPLARLVTEFSATSTSNYTTEGPLAIYEVEGGALSVIEFDDDSHLYSIAGEATCTTVTHIYHREEVDGALSEEFVDFECNGQSYVTLYIWDMN